jgi:ubiquinone/menaquinone biosynthesis C-methylase UbiE
MRDSCRNQLALLCLVQSQRAGLLDLSPGMLSQAQLKVTTTRTTFIQGNVQQLPFHDSCFDTVVDTFSYCVYSDPARAAKEMVRVLVPGVDPTTHLQS